MRFRSECQRVVVLAGRDILDSLKSVDQREIAGYINK